MNLNDEVEETFFNQYCFELAKLLRTEQTEDFLHLYDSLPLEWNGARLEIAKEKIRQLQEYDDDRFQSLYQRTFSIRTNDELQSPSNMSNQPPSFDPTTRITSLPLLQQKQHYERITANNLACDETHEITSKHSSSLVKKNMDESNSKTRRLQPITNNKNTTTTTTHDSGQNTSRMHTPVDSFVQLNLKPAINIRLEDYKKARDTMSISKTNNLQSQLIDSNETNQQSTSSLNNVVKKSSMNFDDFTGNNTDMMRIRSRSSSSSSVSINPKNDLLMTETLCQSNTFGHSKLIAKNDFDSCGSSIATKSSSENSGSARTGSDSDDEHHQSNTKHLSSQLSREKSLNNYDDTPTIVLNQTSENRSNQHGCISSLPDQNSYELVKLDSSEEPPSLRQVPRFKQSAFNDPNNINNSTQDFVPYTTQRPQQNHFTSSSHSNRNSERHEHHNPNHSNSSRKPSSRTTKKRKQSQQQEIIRTELIPGHRGDLDVDELVMFIDGNLSSKTRHNSASLRTTDTNSNSNNSNSTSRRKSRKSSKTHQDNLTKSSPNDDDTQLIDYPDDENRTNTTTHSLTEQISLPDDDESHSNTTNGEMSLHSTSSIQDDTDSLSFSSTILNNSNSEIISEPFVTVTHRRRSIKERRPDNNNNNSFRTLRLPDKRRFQPSIQNGMVRSTISTNKSSVSMTTKEENIDSTPLPPPPPPPPLPTVYQPPTSSTPIVPVSSASQTTTSGSNHVPEQLSPRLSSHSSSSSLSSLLKRQSKAPPVVFLNKSADIELNDVSFGFDVDNLTTEKSATPPPTPSVLSSEPIEPTNEKEIDSPSFSRPSYQQRHHSRGPFFYSGSDIRPQQHRAYPSQPSYIDPLLLLQYNQQRYQHIAYMNFIRTQYIPTQSPYVIIPTGPTYETNQDEKNETSENIREPLLVYATIPGQTGPIYYQSTKKSFQSMYPSTHYYPTDSAYFQPISSSYTLSMDNKSQHDETDNDEEVEDDEDHNLEKSNKNFEQTRQQSSSNIMSNALQLVYSQEKRNAQTDRFNLDQLTAYLAMKWTDTVDHYEKGDDEILLVSEQ